MMTMAATVLEQVSEDQGHSEVSATGVEPGSCGLALVGHGEAYNEEAFHHFLAIERKRSEASMRPFLLLLVEFEQSLASAAYVDRDVAGGIFSALASSLRDTDVIGWYREDRIAGAVLTDLDDTQGVAPEQITDRVRRVVKDNVPVKLASLVQVRIYQLPVRS
jgi:hypothetical protein